MLARLDSDASVGAGFDNEEVVSHSLTTFFGEAGGGRKIVREMLGLLSCYLVILFVVDEAVANWNREVVSPGAGLLSD